MTTLHEGLYTRLTTDGGISALAGLRVYPLALPYQPILPAITYQDITLRTEQQFGSTALKIYRVQINAWAVSHSAATTLADTIISCMDGYSGAMGAQCDVTLVGRVDLIDPETQWYHVALDFEVWTN